MLLAIRTMVRVNSGVLVFVVSDLGFLNASLNASSGHQRHSPILFPPRRKFASSIQGSFLINVFFFYWIRAFLGSFKLSFLITYEVKERKKENTACYLIFGDGGEESGDASGGRSGEAWCLLGRLFGNFVLVAYA